jgi:NADPH:quinone reductase-like Zn-dependent oxidoreductase
LAGIVTQVGIGVEGVTVGDEILGFTDRRASHAEYVVVDALNLTRKPANVSWEVAGSLAIAGSTAYASNSRTRPRSPPPDIARMPRCRLLLSGPLLGSHHPLIAPR